MLCMNVCVCLGIAKMCSGNYEVVKEAENEDDEMKAEEKSPDLARTHTELGRALWSNGPPSLLMREDIVVWVDDATGAGLIEGLGGRFLVLFGIERNTASVTDDRLRVFGVGGSQVGFWPGTDSALIDGFDAIDGFRAL